MPLLEYVEKHDIEVLDTSVSVCSYCPSDENAAARFVDYGQRDSRKTRLFRWIAIKAM